MSCIDARGDKWTLGTPGGDFAEFYLVCPQGTLTGAWTDQFLVRP